MLVSIFVGYWLMYCLLQLCNDIGEACTFCNLSCRLKLLYLHNMCFFVPIRRHSPHDDVFPTLRWSAVELYR